MTGVSRFRSIRAKFGLAFVTASLVLVGIGGVVLMNADRLGTALDALRVNGSALRQHTLADMYHDALRGDVYAILHDAAEGQAVDEGVKQLDEDAASFTAAADALAKMPLSSETRQAVAGVRPKIDAYISHARSIGQKAKTDPAGAEADLKPFLARFSELEAAMDEVGNFVEQSSVAVEEKAIEDKKAAALQIGGAGVVVLLLILAGFFWVGSHIVTPIRRLSEAVLRIKDGKDLAVPGADRADEIGEVARNVFHIGSLGRDNQLTVAAMNGSDTMLMITDPDEKMVFVSAKLVDLLMTLEPVFREAREDFSVTKMQGQHLDYYRANPALKRELLLDDGKQRKVRYEIGGQTLIVDMAYIFAVDGTKIGHTLLWRDVTDELKGQTEVAKLVKAAQEGDFSGRIETSGKQGFVHDMAEGLNSLAILVEGAVDECASVMQAVADGDLTKSLDTRYKGSLGRLSASINDTIYRLSETVETLKVTASDVAMSATEITSGANDLSNRTEQQASSLEETAATTEQLAASVKASAQASRQAVQLADESRRVAQSGGAIVQDAVGAMSRIENASKKISDITGVIDEIAFQTNLLALNAAVEAARAGEAGKGFAVVASEVRTLAQRSSEAAKEITALIAASATEVDQGVKLVRSAGEALGQIVGASDRVSHTIEDIATASTEQANGIDEMSQAVAHMDEMTQQNAALAEESAASATSLSDKVDRLDRLIASFRTNSGAVQSAAPPLRSRRVA
jgi:methyl-accepting chemotaxis protein